LCKTVLLSRVMEAVQGYMRGVSTSTRASLYLLAVTALSWDRPADPSPSYWAQPNNFLNIFFVKFAWGWTFLAVLLYSVLSHRRASGSWVRRGLAESLVRLGAGTAVWYCFARLAFPWLEQLTGVCTLSSQLTRSACYRAGHRWTGFDISGHCFLLTWNNLFMLEEFTSLTRQVATTELYDPIAIFPSLASEHTVSPQSLRSELLSARSKRIKWRGLAVRVRVLGGWIERKIPHTTPLPCWWPGRGGCSAGWRCCCCWVSSCWSSPPSTSTPSQRRCWGCCAGWAAGPPPTEASTLAHGYTHCNTPHNHYHSHSHNLPILFLVNKI